MAPTAPWVLWVLLFSSPRLAASRFSNSLPLEEGSSSTSRWAMVVLLRWVELSMPPPLYEYQQRCVQAAKGENLLVVLPTNSGKTRIAAELFDHYLTQWRNDTSESRKRKWCVLLTPTGPLAEQQGLVLADNCGLEIADAFEDLDDDADGEGASWRVGIVRGQLGPPLAGPKAKSSLTASNAWQRCATLVMTPALLADSLIHARVTMPDILLLTDSGKPRCHGPCTSPVVQAHQLKGTSEYAILMSRFYSAVPQEQRPRVLALTASPLSGRSPNGKTWQPATEEDMKKELEDLEEKVDCRTWTELSLVESAMMATAVEERFFEAPPASERDRELLELIESCKLDDPIDAARRWDGALTRFEVLATEELGEWAVVQGLQLLSQMEGDVLLEDDEETPKETDSPKETQETS
eukprot:g3444.t1